MGILERVEHISLVPKLFKGMIYSPPGAGKTKLSAEAPSPLFLDSEDSTDTLSLWPELAKECKVLHIRDKQDMDEILTALQKKSPELADRKTVVLDTFSEMAMNTLSELSTKYTKTSTTGARKLHVPFQSDYLENGEYLRSLVLDFKRLDRNLIITAHERDKVDKEGNVLGLGPDMPPKLAKTIAGTLSFVGYLTLDTGMKGEKDDRKIQMRGTKRLIAKTRYGTQSIIDSPTLLSILNLKEWN